LQIFFYQTKIVLFGVDLDLGKNAMDYFIYFENDSKFFGYDLASRGTNPLQKS